MFFKPNFKAYLHHHQLLKLYQFTLQNYLVTTITQRSLIALWRDCKDHPCFFLAPILFPISSYFAFFSKLIAVKALLICHLAGHTASDFTSVCARISCHYLQLKSSSCSFRFLHLEGEDKGWQRNDFHFCAYNLFIQVIWLIKPKSRFGTADRQRFCLSFWGILSEYCTFVIKAVSQIWHFFFKDWFFS